MCFWGNGLPRRHRHRSLGNGVEKKLAVIKRFGIVRGTMMPRNAIILAAGKGERLANGSPSLKPLAPVASKGLIFYVLDNLQAAGIEEVGIVVGHMASQLKAALSEHTYSFKIHFFDNPQYHKPNGTSLLCARSFVTEPTLLTMSDHLWSPTLLERLSRSPVHPQGASLAVDYRIDACFDLEDATKVQVQGQQIQAIDKALAQYNALDCGVFIITPALIKALATLDQEQGCSLSEGVRVLAEAGTMQAVDIGDAAWLDVDTPESMAYAQAQLHRFVPLQPEFSLATPSSIPASAG